jgi:dUTP pyrophosphatase
MSSLLVLLNRKRKDFMKTLDKIALKIQMLPHACQVPTYATEGAAGMDLYASLENPFHIKPMQRFAVPTGLIFEVPQGYEAQIRARSGLSIKHGICLVNGVGTVDADYRGEVKVLIINLGDKTYTINPGDRVAQAVISPVAKADISIVAEVTQTDRSSGGFGSTGL